MEIKIKDKIENNNFKTNFLQTEEWAYFKNKEGWSYFFLHFYKNKELLGYTVLLEKKEKFFKINYVPRGPIVSKISDLSSILPLIKDFSKKRGAHLLKIEPDLEFSDENLKYFSSYKSVKDFYQPIQTAIIYLEDDLIKNIPSKKRGRIRNKENLIFRETQELDNFYKIYKSTFENKNFKGRGEEYFYNMKEIFKDRMKIFEVLKDNEVISASVNILNGDTITYLYSGSLKEYNNLYPGYLLVYNTALYAKEKGFKNFDLWGISDENEKWKGFSEFKMNLGGKPFRFLGSFDFIFNSLYYSIYKSVK